MEFLIIGIVSALNLIVIVQKFKRGRIEDGIFDTTLFILVSVMFSGSYGGMVVAMISSLVISMYLFASPPTFFRSFAASNEIQKTIKEIKTFATTNQSLSASTSRWKEKDFNFD